MAALEKKHDVAAKEPEALELGEDPKAASTAEDAGKGPPSKTAPKRKRDSANMDAQKVGCFLSLRSRYIAASSLLFQHPMQAACTHAALGASKVHSMHDVPRALERVRRAERCSGRRVLAQGKRAKKGEAKAMDVDEAPDRPPEGSPGTRSRSLRSSGEQVILRSLCMVPCYCTCHHACHPVSSAMLPRTRSQPFWASSGVSRPAPAFISCDVPEVRG